MWIYLWICLWVNTYRYIFSGMNINLPAILGFTRYQGFDPSPYYLDKLLGWWYVHVYGIIIVHEMGIPTNNTNRKWVWEMMISSGNQTWQVKILHCWMILPFKSFPWIFLWEKPWFFNGKKHGFNGKTIYKWWIFHCHLWWNQRVNLPKTIDKTGHRLRLVGITHRETKELDDPSLFPCKFAIAIGAYPWTKAIQPSSHTVGHPVIFPWYSHEICYFSPKK